MRRALALVLAVAIILAACTLLVINRLGGPGDRPLPAVAGAPHPLRIVALGTSLTKRALWPDWLAARLRQCAPTGSVVERVAKPGAGSVWALGQADAITAGSPDLVIIELAMNDADLTDGLWLGQSRANHERLIRRLRAQSPGTSILLLTTNPVTGIAHLTRPVLPIYQRLYGALADSEGAGLIDGFSRWRALPGYAARIADGVHPDPQAEADLLSGPLFAAIAAAFPLTCP